MNPEARTVVKQHAGGLLEAFEYNAGLRFDLLDQLTEEQLVARWPRPGLDTFAKHFRELAAVQQSLVRALREGTLDFGTVPSVFEMQGADKDTLRRELEEVDRELRQAVEQMDPEQVVVWGEGIEMGVLAHLANVMAHETLHHGQMLMALYVLDIPVPESWKSAWAVPGIDESAG